jgi:hypothetical protein
MAKNNNGLPQRGALLVTLKPSTPTLTAGTSFSISVTTTNPFDVAVTIQDVSTLLPVDLFDVKATARLKEQRKVKEEFNAYRYELLKQFGANNITRIKTKREGLLRSIFRVFFNAAIPGLLPVPKDFFDDMVDTYASAITTVAERSGKTSVQRLASELKPAQYEIQQGLSDEEIQKKVDLIMEGLEKEYKKNLEAETKSPIILQPGDSVTNVFVLRTRKGWNFRPTSFNLDVTVQYLVDNETHHQTIPYTLDIQAAPGSTVWGAVLGSVFGVLAGEMKIIFEGDWLTVVPKLIVSMILSAFAVIAFARKAGVQPIIAIQDFWGGLLIGFLVGYSGTQVLGNLFGNADAAAIAATPTPTP